MGIAGHYGPLIPIHLWINLVVFVLVVPHILSWTLPSAAHPGAVAAA